MKRIFLLLLSAILILGVLSVPVFADSATIALSKSSVVVGTNVTVTITYKATYDIYGLDATLTYNSAVLQFVSGGTDTGKSVKIVKDLEGGKSASASVVFKAIAAGSGSLSLSAKASGTGDGSASAGTAVTVTTVKPSTNANLGSINLSEGKLTPTFKQGTTNYTASVKDTTEKITIKANAAAGDATVSGAGTFNLKEGDNRFDLTVTAASGAKKIYTVTVRRMTAEETLEAEKEERENNPRLIVVGGTDYFLETELKDIGVVDGFENSFVERKGSKIEVLSDKAGKYQIYFAKDIEGQNGTFFTADESGEFKALDYIKLGSKLYIIEPFEDMLNIDEHFAAGEYELSGRSVKCYKYADEDITGFYVFNCYINGKNGYYMFDAEENTMQREPMFIAKPVEINEVDSKQPESLLQRFATLTTQAKTVLILLLFAVALVIVLTVLLIVRATKRENDTIEDENLEFDELLGIQNQNFDETDISDVPSDEPQVQSKDHMESKTEDSEFLEPDSDDF